jgi:uncharacterized protein
MFKPLFLVIGTISLGLGFIGIFLPVLPTTPFVLLALYLFSKGHPDKVKEVMNHPRFKPFIEDYFNDDGIPLRAKVKALIVLWVSILFSILFFIQSLYLRLIVLTSASLVTLYILNQKTKK